MPHDASTPPPPPPEATPADLLAAIRPGKLFLGGAWEDASDGGTIPTINPSTEEIVTEVAHATAKDVDRAVKAARQAFDEGPWPRMNAAERGRILWRAGELVAARAAAFAVRETAEMGKVLSEGIHVEVPLAAEILRYYAGHADKILGETIPVRGKALAYTLREPVGVVGTITPWNFPMLLAVWKIAPALACGNTVVHKPSEETSLSSLLLAEVLAEAGVPAGVFNVVTGAGSTTGAALVRHPGVDKIAFTGGTATGETILRDAAGTRKKVSLELGGKSPNLVFADADLDAAARGAFLGIFYNKGEVCAAGSRLLVEESVHDALLEKLLARVAKARPGDPMHPKTRLGPLANRAQFEKVQHYVTQGQAEGATLVAGGRTARVHDSGKGFFFEPTVFDGVDNAMTIAREEIFGPVLSVISFRDVEDAIRIANDTIYGLASGVWTRDISKAHTVARAIRAGTVWVNTYNLYDPGTPFGGMKQSGFGRELGIHAIEGYTQVKTVWVDLG